MKHIFIALVIGISLLSCDKKTTENNEKVDSVALGTGTEANGRFLFEETSFDFGTIKQGEIVKHSNSKMTEKTP
jgi:hypothetical protein